MEEYDAFCMTMEKEQLLEELRSCEYCTTSIEAHNSCRQKVAKENRERMRNCRWGSFEG
ncbi:hypothetical protein DENIS_4843 [Desulfonema ishimotonii]|uniref:Uncharacterized protein n=1 Tax=Desulfonema ishimotonii TaxID=45657 RepID=A0A401G3P8_9BACT|nr:hypothetical protein [Desulfonema ishimotonii]GBC63844.1 hypothetical protein DENIS_4843 [Desulfonema ishimotonii]